MSELVAFFNGVDWKPIALVLLLLSIFIDITPAVKFNPWKAILKKFGGYINSSIENEISDFKKDVYEKIDTLSANQTEQFNSIRKEQKRQAEIINNLIRDINYREMSRLRWEVIDFEANIVRGNKYPREKYRHILDEADKFLRMAADDSVQMDKEGVIKIEEIRKRVEKHYSSQRAEQPDTLMI